MGQEKHSTNHEEMSPIHRRCTIGHNTWHEKPNNILLRVMGSVCINGPILNSLLFR